MGDKSTTSTLLFSSFLNDNSTNKKPRSVVDEMVAKQMILSEHFTDIQPFEINSGAGFEQTVDANKRRAQQQHQAMIQAQDADPMRMGFPILQESLGNKTNDWMRSTISVPLDKPAPMVALPTKNVV
jgi:hypothetical protein